MKGEIFLFDKLKPRFKKYGPLCIATMQQVHKLGIHFCVHCLVVKPHGECLSFMHT
jgi:hypothetical protein